MEKVLKNSQISPKIYFLGDYTNKSEKGEISRQKTALKAKTRKKRLNKLIAFQSQAGLIGEKMCLNPKWIYKKGFYKDSNYRGEKGDFYELGTYAKCGHCEICNAEKANNWVIRNYYENKTHIKKCFITLTYANSPIILVKSDLQRFFKRLRRHLEYRGYNEKIRYYACGEYGEKNGRPHYHVIIYGWNDENAIYKGINKRTNLYYESEIIKKCWGLGRTSYQEFNTHEIPYISLYETPKEQFKRAYKLNFEKIKKLERYYYENLQIEPLLKIHYQKELEKIRKELTESKEKFYLAKEFNTWSTALGWHKFYDEYSKKSFYNFEEYIEDKIFVTPTPWVKKLANKGDIQAAKEMYKREKEIEESTSEEEERIKNIFRKNRRKKDDILKWSDQKTELEEL